MSGSCLHWEPWRIYLLCDECTMCAVVHKKSTGVFEKICFDMVEVCTTMNLGWDVDPKVDCVLPLVARCLITSVSLGNTRAQADMRCDYAMSAYPLTSLPGSVDRPKSRLGVGLTREREREQKSERESSTIPRSSSHLDLSSIDIRLTIMSTFGHLYRVHTYGESHCRSVGAIIDGVPPVSSHLIASRFPEER